MEKDINLADGYTEDHKQEEEIQIQVPVSPPHSSQFQFPYHLSIRLLFPDLRRCWQIHYLGKYEQEQSTGRAERNWKD